VVDSAKQSGSTSYQYTLWYIAGIVTGSLILQVIEAFS